MDINLEFLESLTAEDISAITVGRDLLDKARTDVAAFRENCLFHIGETSLTVYSSLAVQEYIFNTGIWQRRSGSDVFELQIDVEPVFDAYKKVYLDGTGTKLTQNVEAFRDRARQMRNHTQPVGDDNT